MTTLPFSLRALMGHVAATRGPAGGVQTGRPTPKAKKRCKVTPPGFIPFCNGPFWACDVIDLPSLSRLRVLPSGWNLGSPWHLIFPTSVAAFPDGGRRDGGLRAQEWDWSAFGCTGTCTRVAESKKIVTQ